MRSCHEFGVDIVKYTWTFTCQVDHVLICSHLCSTSSSALYCPSLLCLQKLLLLPVLCVSVCFALLCLCYCQQLRLHAVHESGDKALSQVELQVCELLDQVLL